MPGLTLHFKKGGWYQVQGMTVHGNIKLIDDDDCRWKVKAHEFDAYCEAAIRIEYPKETK